MDDSINELFIMSEIGSGKAHSRNLSDQEIDIKFLKDKYGFSDRVAFNLVEDIIEGSFNSVTK